MENSGLQMVEAVLLSGLWVLALAGYGGGFMSLLPVKLFPVGELGFQAVVGLSLYLAFCGPVELLGLGSSRLFSVVLGLGLALSLVMNWRVFISPNVRFRSKDWGGRGPAVLLTILTWALALFVINASQWTFNNFDDTQGYLVIPQRILQLGSTTADPFFYRRFEAGLGGSNYIYAMFLSFVDDPYIRIADLGSGAIILWALLLGHLRAEGTAGWRAVLVAGILLAAIAFCPSINATPDITGMAIVFAGLRLATVSLGVMGYSRAILMALILSALVCLKTTYLVPAVCLASALYLWLIALGPRLRSLIEALAVAIGVGAICAAWMLVSYRGAGTLLFPFFGIGRLSPDEVEHFTGVGDFIKSGGRIAILLVWPAWRAWTEALKGWHRGGGGFLIVLAVVFCFGILAAQTKFTVAGYRYGYTAAAAVMLFFAALRNGHSASIGQGLSSGALAAIILGNLALYAVFQPAYGAESFTHGFLYQRFFGTSASDTTLSRRNALLRMQAAVPPGEPILVRLDTPYLLDFRRQPLYVMDWPGLAGPPGLPQDGNSTAWQTYLRSLGIRYVAYSYGNEAGMSGAYIAAQLQRTGSIWQRKLLTRTAEVQAMLASLRRSDDVVFDDGLDAVVRLREAP